MGVYNVTAFDGTTIVTGGVCVVDSWDTGNLAYTRIGILENGAKYDADGTADSDTTYGSITVLYQVPGSAAGNASLNTAMGALEGLVGKYGTLTATVDAGTKTCNARCVEATPVNYSVSTDPPIGAARKMRAFIMIKWERFSNWA